MYRFNFIKLLNIIYIIIFVNMKNIVLILAVILSSCTKVYKEIWTVEKYPTEWEEEIVIPGDHLHYKDTCQDWTCVYWETDTFCWHHYDTLEVRKLEKTIRIK